MGTDIPKGCDRCMKCVASCVVAKMGGHSIASELHETAGNAAWNCANCWKCEDVCPQGVDIFGFMMKRRMEEEVPELIRKGIDGIFSAGFWFGEIQFNDVRESFMLPAVRLLGQEKVALLMAEEGERS